MKKVIIWVVVLIVVLAGVYLVLPEYPKSVVKSVFQPVLNSQAKSRIDEVKNLKNGKIDATYETILEGKVKTPTWIYESAGTVEKVTFQGSGADINIKDVEDHEDFLYQGCIVKFEFVISGNKVDIYPYIDGTLQDDVIKDVMLEQLYIGAASITS